MSDLITEVIIEQPRLREAIKKSVFWTLSERGLDPELVVKTIRIFNCWHPTCEFPYRIITCPVLGDFYSSEIGCPTLKLFYSPKINFVFFSLKSQ